MNNYIYELNVARLRMEYLLPEGVHLFQVSTILKNQKPHDGSNIEMVYQAIIKSPWEETAEGLAIADAKVYKVLEGESLQDLTEQCRIFSKLLQSLQNEQSTVNNFTTFQPEHE